MIDTSVAINLVASGFATEIIEALPNRVVAANTVSVELELGRRSGRPHAALVEDLVRLQSIDVVSISEAAEIIFEGLVIGRAVDTLDDGEAATLACAIDSGYIPIIDERKAARLCNERYPGIRLGHTCDLFCHPAVIEGLGRDRLGLAVLNALRQARMQVQGRFIEWVVDLIGIDDAALCPSLPRRALASIGGADFR